MRKFGLIGKSLGHSFSKTFFTQFFSQNEVAATYENFELETIDEVKQLLESDCEGFNVTIPYKEAIIPFLDELGEEAKAIGAVNCVVKKDGKWVGHNTDAYGFQQSIKPFLTNRHERAVIFGTGGAAKAVEYVLKGLGIDSIFISRTPQRYFEFGYDEVNDHMVNACRLLVNTTPVGTFPKVDECIEIPFEHLTKDHLVVDLIYNPVKTKFLQCAEENEAMILNGETMLKQQALKSWELWNQ